MPLNPTTKSYSQYFYSRNKGSSNLYASKIWATINSAIRNSPVLNTFNTK